jgi:hypothetical protein
MTAAGLRATERETSPKNLEAERAVLGAILVDDGALSRVRSIVGPHDFFRRAHRLIFTSACRLSDRAVAVDLLTLKNDLAQAGELDDVDGAAYIASLTDGVPRGFNVEDHARIVKNSAIERLTLERMNHARRRIQEGQLGQALASLRRLVDDVSAAEDVGLLLEPASTVAARNEAMPPRQRIEGLLPADGTTLVFGPPRSMKSLLAREIAAAVSGHRPAFGLARLRVDDPVPVAYLCEEDSARDILGHLDAFSDGRASAGDLPLYLSACRGISIDDPRVQDRIIIEVKTCGAGLVILEPLRSITATVDQGPRDLWPFVQFVRRLIRETGVALLLGHHEVKKTTGTDLRKGAERVSGGGLFSVSESPIMLERLDESRVLVRPTAWKHFGVPAPFTIRLETEHGRVRRLIGEEYAPVDREGYDHLSAKVLDVVTTHPGLSSSAIVARVGGRRDSVLRTLPALEDSGKVRSAKEGRSQCWFPHRSEGQ